jgi:hypothetical protein
VLFIREIDLEKSVNILAILSDKEGSRIERQYLGIPVSSATSERLFSTIKWEHCQL